MDDHPCICILIQCLPGMNGIGLPETGGKMNISFGYFLNSPCDAALRSTDKATVAAYLQAAPPPARAQAPVSTSGSQH